jgi:hypothetical protein
MDTADAMAAKSYIDQMAAALRNGGLDAPLGALRVLAMGDLTFEPIARGTCDHAHAEDHYTPSRKLRHLVRATRGRAAWAR